MEKILTYTGGFLKVLVLMSLIIFIVELPFYNASLYFLRKLIAIHSYKETEGLKSTRSSYKQFIDRSKLFKKNHGLNGILKMTNSNFPKKTSDELAVSFIYPPPSVLVFKYAKQNIFTCLIQLKKVIKYILLDYFVN